MWILSATSASPFSCAFTQVSQKLFTAGRGAGIFVWLAFKNSADCDLLIDEKSTSRLHCTFQPLTQKQLCIIDSSTFGTFVFDEFPTNFVAGIEFEKCRINKSITLNAEHLINSCAYISFGPQSAVYKYAMHCFINYF